MILVFITFPNRNSLYDTDIIDAYKQLILLLKYFALSTISDKLFSVLTYISAYVNIDVC